MTLYFTLVSVTKCNNAARLVLCYKSNQPSRVQLEGEMLADLDSIKALLYH